MRNSILGPRPSDHPHGQPAPRPGTRDPDAAANRVSTASAELLLSRVQGKVGHLCRVGAKNRLAGPRQFVGQLRFEPTFIWRSSECSAGAEINPQYAHSYALAIRFAEKRSSKRARSPRS